ncbi:MAG: hypothetical protein ACTSUR_03570 [Candidatus Heimdallarchaeaceae archaeon]
MRTDENKMRKYEKQTYFQIDITENYKKAFEQISAEKKDSLTPKVKEKIYPKNVSKITYSPQTETVYYYTNNEEDEMSESKTWEIFEDRGALIENHLITNLIEIEEIKEDFEKIVEEERHIQELRNGELLEFISEFIKNYGSKAYRYRQDTATNEKCKIYQFSRANLTDEIILFTSDKLLVISRKSENGDYFQKPLKYMNRTVLSWYYEGLLRMKRLQEKQEYFFRRRSITD